MIGLLLPRQVPYHLPPPQRRQLRCRLEGVYSKKMEASTWTRKKANQIDHNVTWLIFISKKRTCARARFLPIYVHGSNMVDPPHHVIFRNIGKVHDRECLPRKHGRNGFREFHCLC